jgi:HK97 family phage portal protein
MSGAFVNEDNALSVGVFLAGVRLISNAMAMAQIDIYKGDPADGQETNSHPVYSFLNGRANDWAPSMTFRVGMNAKRLIHGNAYAEIEWAPNGKLLNIWPLPQPNYQVTPYNDPNIGLFYRVQAYGGQKDLLPSEILHLRGFSVDGFMGLSLLGYCREQLGLARSMDTYVSKVFSNGARPGGYIKAPGRLGDVAFNRLMNSWNERHQSAERAHRIAILEEGAEWHDNNMDNSEAQLLESRMLSVEDFARIIGVPLSKLRVKGATAFANQEDDGIDFVTNSLMPLMVSDEQEIAHKLLGEPYTAAYDLERILTVNTATRDASFSTLRNLGVYNGDEIRRKLRLKPLPDGIGQDYWQPANQMVAGSKPAPSESQATQQITDEPEPTSTEPATDQAPPAPQADVAGADQAAQAAIVQDTALNGAQIASLQDIVIQAATGVIPISTAKALAAAAFPLLSAAQLDDIFADIKPQAPPQPTAEPEPPAA